MSWGTRMLGALCLNCTYALTRSLFPLFFALNVALAATPFQDFVVLLSHFTVTCVNYVTECILATPIPMMEKVKTKRPLLLLALLAVGIGISGCVSPGQKKEEKQLATLRIFLESPYEDPGRTALVPVFRADPMPVRIDRNPILDETHVVRAEVVDVIGGYAMQIQFDFHGTLVLQQVSNAYRGQRLVIFSSFPEGRWLTAIRMNRPIMDGILVFTPDASREEALKIVTGLNNVAKKLGNQAR